MTDTNNNNTKPKYIAAMEGGRVCKPSRKLFEQQCRELADEINSINTKLVQNKASLNELFAKLDRLREERNERFTQKATVEADVRAMSVNINKVSERLIQLQSKLHYRDMIKLENAIRSLQVHLDSHHFKHSEEKKIVAEIDKLNRSKKVVGEFLSTQSELKQLRSNQHNKRADRDKLIKDIVRIRKLEEETRAQITDSKDLDTNLKSDLTEIKDRKTELKEAFAKHQQTYSEQKAAIKQAEQETKHRKQQVCRQMSSIPTRCMGSGLVEQQVPESPEMVCCHKLLEFCQRLTKTVGEGKAAQRQLKKKISYTPDVLSQFVSIDMVPPMTLLHAKHCIPLLEHKLSELRSTTTAAAHILPQILREDETSYDEAECINEDNENSESQTVVGIKYPEQRSSSTEEMSDDFIQESEQPDDHSDRCSLTKQLSNTSDEDSMESIMHKLTILDSLYQVERELKSNDNLIA